MSHQQCRHKLINQGPETLTDTELMALVLSNEPAAEAIMQQFGGYKGLANQPLEKFLKFDGLGDANIVRFAACFEIARRVVHQVVAELQPYRLL